MEAKKAFRLLRHYRKKENEEVVNCQLYHSFHCPSRRCCRLETATKCVRVFLFQRDKINLKNSCAWPPRADSLAIIGRSDHQSRRCTSSCGRLIWPIDIVTDWNAIGWQRLFFFVKKCRLSLFDLFVILCCVSGSSVWWLSSRAHSGQSWLGKRVAKDSSFYYYNIRRQRKHFSVVLFEQWRRGESDVLLIPLMEIWVAKVGRYL